MSQHDLKNKGIIKIKNCMTSVINIKKGEGDNFVNVLDTFLSNYRSKTKLSKLMSEIFDMLDYAVILNNKTSGFLKKKVKIDDDENYLRFKKKINEGSYGEIHSCLLNKVNVIVKNPVYKKKNKDDINSDFIKENLIHIMLYCCHDLMNKCFGMSSVPRCIPEIMNLVKATDNKMKDDKLIVIMEKLDSDGFDFFEKKHSYKSELTFIALVAYNLYFLQTSLKQFMHRDLHGGNIMIKKLKKAKKVEIVVNKNKLFTLYPTYETYIIDFGMACFDLSSCIDILNMPKSKISNAGIYESNYCDNRCHDMRLFLASLYFSYYDTITDKLKVFLSSLLDKYNANHWHDFYYQVLKKKDKNLHPENILKKIQEELK